MLDLVVDRRDMKATIARALRFMRAEPAAMTRVPVGVGALSQRVLIHRCALSASDLRLVTEP